MVKPRIHSRTIEAVKERADIVDVIGEHLVLKKKGREFVGICPFHDDTKPSMTVSPQKQFYYCFSCGAGGNSIKFLMEFQRQSFSEVVLDLARKYQLPIETLEGPQQERFKQQLSRRESLYKALALASDWFQGQLQSPVGAQALEYLTNSRQLSALTIDSFSLGFAPDQWDGLLNYLTQVQKLPIDLLESAGLVIARKGGGGFYDRFRGRVIVPIRDRQSRVIGFGGRSLDGSEPKYLNSPETEIFEKGKHLFALDKASKSIHKSDLAVVVEGYFDVLALHAAGVDNAVASLGTALSKKQITQLCRCTESKKIVLNFDADRAGIRAANRAINEVEQLSMQGHLELRVLQLPSGKDPDEFLQLQGPSAYRDLIDKAPLWLDWQIDQTLYDRDLTKADQFQASITELVQLLGKLPQSALRTHYLQKVAERLSGGQARLALQLEEDLRKQVKGHRWHGRSRRLEKSNDLSLLERSEAEIFMLYLHSPSIRGQIRKVLRQRDLEDFSIQHHRLLWLAISNLEESNIGASLLESISRGIEPGDELAELDLPRLLMDQLNLENSELSVHLASFLKPGELQITVLEKPILHLLGVTAVLERQKSLKRCRHLLEAWSGQRLQTLEKCISSLIDEESNKPGEMFDMEERIDNMFNELNSEALNFQQLYYNERNHILHLDRQRCSSA